MMLNVHRNLKLIRDGENGVGGGGERGGNEGGGRGRRHTVTTRMTPALRLAAMRAILMFHKL